jgi:flagellar motor switch protein FliG
MSLSITLTPEQQAAVVLVSLSPEAAQPIADRLGPEGLRRVKYTLDGMAHVPRKELLSAFAVFLTELNTRIGGLQGGKNRTLELLESALGPELMQSLSSPNPTVETAVLSAPEDVWGQFGAMETEAIVEFIKEQAAPLGALMISQLPPPKMAETLSELEETKSVELIACLAKDNQPSEAALRTAEAMIETNLLSGSPDLSKDPRLEEVGEILGSLPRSLREAALKKLDEADIDRAAAVRKALLCLEDIPERLPTRGVQTVFREIEPDILMAGLAAASTEVPEASDFLLGNISQRMADQYKENMAEVIQDTQTERDKAIGALLREILSLSRRGQITLIERATKED